MTYIAWTIAIATIAIFLIIASILLYVRIFPLKRFVAPFLLFIFIGAGTWIQISNSYEETEYKQDDAIESYALTHLIQQDVTGSSVYHMKKMWEEAPSTQHTLLFAIALIKDGQLNRGSHLLDELVTFSSTKKDLIAGVPMKQIRELYEHVESYTNAQRTASIEPVDESTSNSWNDQIEVQLDEMKEYMLDENSMNKEDAELISIAHIERLKLLSVDENEEELSLIKQQIREVTQDGEQSRLISDDVKEVFAKSLLYFGEDEEAEQLLIELILKNPTNHEAITLLSELYVQEDYISSDEAKQLPQYTHAHLLISHEKMDMMQEWIKSESYEKDSYDKANPEEEEEEDFLPSHVLSDEELQANELTYALIQSSPRKDEEADLSVRLSRYYFNKGKNEQARKHIHEILEKEDVLTSHEQLLINTIQYNDQQLAQTKQTNSFVERQHYLEEIYNAKEKLYNTFHTSREQEPQSISEESFEYFLSESVRDTEEKGLSIMTVDASDNGEVTMYVNTNNMDLIDKQKAELTDQWDEIDSFTIEKIGENISEDSVDRSIGMVIDVSGSMEGDRIEVARNSSETFIKDMKDYEQIELVKFESTPSLVEEFTQDKDRLTKGVRSLEAGGGTKITEALLFEIDRIKDEAGQKVIFIFSDGEDDVFSKVESRAQIIDLANAHGIVIFAVGFGAGYETLSEVATETGGMYIAAPNAATIDDGFKQIEDVLSSTYKVNYTLNNPKHGKRLAQFTYDGFTDEKYYVLGNVDYILDTEKAAPSFDIFQAAPYTIYQSDLDDIKVTLQGIGFQDIDELSIGQRTLTNYDVINDQTIEVYVPGEIPLGKQTIEAKNEDGKYAATTLQVTSVGLQNEVQLGYATLYADKCTKNKNEVDCSGDLSIDHFMYPEGSNMKVTDDEYVTFNGVQFQVKESKLSFFKNMLDSNGSHLVGNMVMKKDDKHGENFSLTYGNSSGLSVNKLDMSVKINEMKYKAYPERKPGDFTAETSFNGIPKDASKSINTENFIVLEKIAPFLSTSASLKLTISPTEANIMGEADLNDIEFFGVGLNSPVGSIEYDDLNKRIAVTGEVDGFSIFKSKVKGIEDKLNKKNPGSKIKGFDYMIGFETPFRPAFGLTVNGTYPLGTTGLALKKLGASVDFTSRMEGTLTTGIGTIADEAIQVFATGLNEIKIASVPLFKIDLEEMNLLGADLDGKVSEVLSPSWNAEGSVGANLLGFSLLDIKGSVNASYLDLSIEGAVLPIEGSGRMTFKDPNYANRFVVYSNTKIEKQLIATLTAELDTRLIPSNMSQSEVKVSGTIGEFPFALSTDNLEIFR